MMHQYLGNATREIAKATGANKLVFIRRIGERDEKVPVHLTVIKETEGGVERESRQLDIKMLPPTSIVQIRQVILQAINEELLHRGDKVFCITDSSMGEGFEGLMFIFTIDDDFMAFSTRELEEEVTSSVYESVMKLATDLAREGREGEDVGTAFILGDHGNVLDKSKQLVLNPFRGHPPEERNVSDPGFVETVKEYAQMDGVFVIDDDGFIEAGGRFLNVDVDTVHFPGLGTRHHACAAVTRETDAVAVVVSESGGTVRVFRNGNLILEEKTG